MKRIIFCVSCFVFILTFQACGRGLQTAVTDGKCDASLSFEKNIEPIFSNGGSGHCVNCHNSKYHSVSAISANRQDVYQEIFEGSMPQDTKGFKGSEDGKIVLSWLACPTLK